MVRVYKKLYIFFIYSVMWIDNEHLENYAGPAFSK